MDDAKVLRRAYGTFATGVTVVTVGGSVPHGMTANSFTTVSLDPPLVLICVGRSAVMHEALQRTGTFGVSVLASDQERVARYFADPRRPLGGDQFDAVDWFAGPQTAAPLMVDALAQFECELWRCYDGGDHSIFVGRLLSLERGSAEDALLFCHGRFARLDTHPSEVTA
ncbi:flavin reductase family protein [Dactylosporangium sp. NPDC051485]|uniref:flavin reductase family protein n=1 Tax=Dactylosporangium sp. NPDC051485 TaxID=3154846 RepID=UPI003422E741